MDTVTGQLVRRADGQIVATATLTVGGDPDPDLPDVWLSGDYPDGIVVPDGQTWQVVTGETVTTPANVVVHGTLKMRGSGDAASPTTLRFRDVNESGFVGGHTDVPLATDVGLWVVGHGRLDAQGTPRAGWNRTGTDPSWQPGDETLVAPCHRNDTDFVPFTPGAPVPRAYPQVPPAEVVNLSRDVTIEGTAAGRAHVQFLHCHRPQTVTHVAVRHMGPDAMTGRGRYGFHFHHCHDGSRGSLVEGVVVRDVGTSAFVPHLSHGITFRDCIAYRASDWGWWWDEVERGHLCRDAPFEDECNLTDDVLYDRCLAAYIGPGSGDGFLLLQGHRDACVDCVAVLVSGGDQASGFHWPSRANHSPNVWLFEGCVAHHCPDGIFVWQNDKHDHIVDRFVAYHCGRAGIDHGAYGNRYVYRDSVLIGNSGGHGSHLPSGQLVHHAVAGEFNDTAGARPGYRHVTFDAAGAPGRSGPNACVTVMRSHGTSDDPFEWFECEFLSDPVLLLDEKSPGNPLRLLFTRPKVGGEGRGMTPDDVVVAQSGNGTIVRVVNDDGAWQRDPDGTVRTVQPDDPWT